MTSCVVLFALIVAQRTPDTEHPYEHTRAELMERQADADFVARIETAVHSAAEVQEVETLWGRKSGLEYFADIHIQV